MDTNTLLRQHGYTPTSVENFGQDQLPTLGRGFGRQPARFFDRGLPAKQDRGGLDDGDFHLGEGVYSLLLQW